MQPTAHPLARLTFAITTLILIIGTSPLHASPMSPLPGNGITPEWCDVRSPAASGSGTLADRIERFNKGQACKFYIFFTFANQIIAVDQPLVLEKNLASRDPNDLNNEAKKTGTYIRGTGTAVEPLNIVVDGRSIPGNDCVFQIKEGFAAKQQIHGITIIAKDKFHAICDEDNHDLLSATTTNCGGNKTGAQCEFAGVTVVPLSNDTDGDGINDDIETSAGTDPTKADSDGDGDDDGADNCPTLSNADQANADGDAKGDACDEDDDNDTVLDTADNCPLISNLDQTNSGGDAQGDACVDDNDGDTVVDTTDNCPLVANTEQLDNDGDGTGDACDPYQCNGINISDSNACTTDACDALTGTVSHTPIAVDDGNACTTDVCDAGTGTISHTPTAIDDSNACTVDACNSSTGTVTHDPAVADDGNACTVDACDAASGLTHTPVTIDDGNACTQDFCDAATGVGHLPITGGACAPPAGAAATCDSFTAATSAGGGFDLTWTTTNATSVSVKEGATEISNNANPATPVHVAPAAATDYTLTANGAGGSCTRTITLTPGQAVPTQPTCEFSDTAGANNSITLTWTTTNATTVTVKKGSEVISSDASGTNQQTIAAQTTFTLDASGNGGSCSKVLVLSPSGSGGNGLVDTDGDGILDGTETLIGTNPAQADSDGDSVNDPLDCAPTDATKKTISECSSTITVINNDPDADGICNPGSQTPTGCTMGTDNKGDNCPFAANAGQEDGDTDGIGDICDPSPSGSDSPDTDSDGDGITDSVEILSPLYPSLDPTEPDSDHDGVCDGPGTVKDGSENTICAPVTAGKGDNCPLVSNGPNTADITPENIQKDTDANGTGDACEGDTDGDTIVDTSDNCPFVPNTDQADEDKNGFGDDCDPNFSVSPASGGGCGCRIDGQTTPSQGTFWAFLGLGLPFLILRGVRKFS